MTKSLNDVEWKEFQIVNVLSNSINAKPYHSNELIEANNNGIPYITRTNLNNGLYNTVRNDINYCENPKCSISFGAENATYFFQPFKYITGNKMYYYKNQKLNKYSCLFITCCLNKAIKNCGFGYGMGLTGNRSDKKKIMLPVNSKNEPDYEFMEEYIREKEQNLKQKYKKYIQNRIDKLEKFVNEEKEWKEFEISNICDIKAGKRLTKADMSNGKIPFIGSTDQNNGITNFVSNINSSTDKNILGVNYNGSVVETFYHSYKCTFSDDVKRLSTKKKDNSNKYNYLFIANCIKKQKCKYMYGYKFNEKRMKRQKIMLPINSKNEPDYKYMENYMKYLEQKKLLKIFGFYKITLSS